MAAVQTHLEPLAEDEHVRTAENVDAEAGVVTRIVREARHLLGDHAAYERMAMVANPYGDGHASERIARVLCSREQIPARAESRVEEVAVS